MERCDVLELKDELEYQQKIFQNAQKTLDMCGEALDDAQIKYRVAEVKYVLDGVVRKNREGELSTRDLETYVTHCMNVLNGNIDGTVLNMEEEVEE